MQKWISLIGLLGCAAVLNAQQGYWQQKVDYSMKVSFDASKHQYTGKQVLIYENNSPDTLTQVFYHLYYNAFQPGSSMDIRSRWLPDPDARVGARVAALKPDEIGYQRVKALKQDGVELKHEANETILEVKLNKPILPGKKATFEMEFEAQVPIQIRRSGRNSAEGIAYSMSQWYPKMAEYDKNGWHPNPYIAREFYGVWGNYDVEITIDSAFTVAATGEIQNPKEVGKGYAGNAAGTSNGANKTWKFKANNVHDFVWAADQDYVHDVIDGPNGMKIHFFYQDDATYGKNWREMQASVYKLFDIMNRRFGQYPYSTYSIIQGGDGGMEYPMATLITGKRTLGSLIGVSVHEVIHSWYQMLLGTNESLYSWMDEGFTTYASDIVMNELQGGEGNFIFDGSYKSYFALVKSGSQEPLTTHADHFNTNRAYSIGSYSMGSLFLSQLGYVMGEAALSKAMLAYYYNWRFKHPTPDDCLREMEKASGLVLDWYKEYWVNQTHTIDYAIKSVVSTKSETQVVLERVGKMPMPVELWVTLKDGKKINYYIPLDLMRGEKPAEGGAQETVLMDDWQWVATQYTMSIPYTGEQIEKMEIDPSQRMADVDRSNGAWPSKSDFGKTGKRRR
ncbi:MAG TPA: M1 family metallopeptidase [Luteibaculaceae bacterium]|nr:M1 family metallopeptidase [Luteibaculaceae bacterium]